MISRGLKFKIVQQVMKEFSGSGEMQTVESWVEVKLIVNTAEASKMKVGYLS